MKSLNATLNVHNIVEYFGGAVISSYNFIIKVKHSGIVKNLKMLNCRML